MMCYAFACIAFGIGYCLASVMAAGRHTDAVQKAFDEGMKAGETRAKNRMERSHFRPVKS